MARLDRRNRVTLSKEILQTLNVKAGDWICFVHKEGTVFIVPIKKRDGD